MSTTHAALAYAARIAYSSKEVLQFTFESAVKYRDSPGVYVECGVAAGAQIIAMAAGAPNKTIYAFDSFEGIPLPSNKDNQMPGIRFLKDWEQKALPDPGKQVLETTGATAVSHDNYLEHLGNSGVNMVNIYSQKGWFEDTVPEAASWIEPISILRLDGDLYNSTYVCLKHLYPKVIKGGLVIVDDWGLPGCQAAVMDYFKEIDQENFLYQRGNVHFIIDNNSKVAYWTK